MISVRIQTEMNRAPTSVLFIILILFIHTTNSINVDVRLTLIAFLSKLANTSSLTPLGWSETSDPCTDRWSRVKCNRQNISVTKLFLSGLNLNGSFDADSLCSDASLAKSLNTLDFSRNNIIGTFSHEIGNCKGLARVHVSRNQFSGILPASLFGLSNLKSIDISYNEFSGQLPDVGRVISLNLFLAQYNQLSGEIPEFDFSNLVKFNLSYNNFSGCIDLHNKLPQNSILGNPELSTQCHRSKIFTRDRILMNSGFSILGLLLLVFIIHILIKRKEKNSVLADNAESSVLKTCEINNLKYSCNSMDQSVVSSPLVVLSSPTVVGLRFEELLRAPAELLGRGENGSVYKVSCENGMTVVVKRVKECAMSSGEFKERMRRIDEVKHLNLLPPLAFYCSEHERLLVYEYQPNGSLHKLLHGTQSFDWPSRLAVAAKVAGALAFAHHELHHHAISHGNLKSTNILFTTTMDPRISEYGLTPVHISEQHVFKSDVSGLGVILLELLTGKAAEERGVDLAKWVLSVVAEEWTAEVFDKSMMCEGVSEERMVSLLQVALKCVDGCAETRPEMKQVAYMINAIVEEEERSGAGSEA